MKSKWWNLLFPWALALLFYLIPNPELGEAGKRLGAVFIVAAFYWILEVVPIYTTSLLIMMLQILLLSEKTLPFLQITTESGGAYLTQAQVFANFANPVIILFLGGLFLAQAATKYQLDINLARVILNATSNRSSVVLMVLMGLTAVFSMFMSNTATTAMMLAVVIPIAAQLPDKDPLRKALILGIPFAANIGGIGTPIGTPPNAVALAALEKNALGISFGRWMMLGVPYMMVLLAVAWGLLLAFFRSSTRTVTLVMEGRFQKSRKAIFVYVVFAATVLLWMTGELTHLTAASVAFIPVVLFSLTGIVGKNDMRSLGWDVLWLIAGGLALGMGMEKTGLDRWVVASVPFATFSPWVLLTGIVVMALALSTFISNTAAANLLVPIAISLSSLHPAGPRLLPVVLALACSVAMALPISTPPNALAYGSGYINSADMLKIGLVISVAGLALILFFSFIWQWAGWL